MNLLPDVSVGRDEFHLDITCETTGSCRKKILNEICEIFSVTSSDYDRNWISSSERTFFPEHVRVNILSEHLGAFLLEHVREIAPRCVCRSLDDYLDFVGQNAVSSGHARMILLVTIMEDFRSVMFG